MVGLLCLELAVVTSPFKSKLRLEAENAVLRHQLIVLRRSLHGRVRLANHERWFFIQLYRWHLSTLQGLKIIRPETLVRWHRAGIRCYWRWKSRSLGGRPQIETVLRVNRRGWNDPVRINDITGLSRQSASGPHADSHQLLPDQQQIVLQEAQRLLRSSRPSRASLHEAPASTEEAQPPRLATHACRFRR